MVELTDLQKYVIYEDGTEKPFDNLYWNNKKEGIYVDIVNGEPLFASIDKFDSKTGWPSFTKSINNNCLQFKTDYSHNMTRVEVRTISSNIHLGHIFNDGPKENGGIRYCINSSALRFIPKEDLEKEGYDQYLALFNQNNVEKAVLAGGCFWGMESLFSKIDGVVNVINGYSGGEISNPTYEIVKTGSSNYAESIEISFDSQRISYQEILKFFFQIHNPTTLNKQQNDIGSQYRSAIFYLNDQQYNVAKKVINEANKSGVFPDSIVTTLEKFNSFYPAEEYHQDYLEKNPNGYNCHFIRKEWKF